MSDHYVVHIEIPAGDTKAAGKFYGEAFGWKIETDPGFDYTMFEAPPGPGGGFVGTESDMYEIGQVVLYIGTDDIEATLAKIESLGGKTLMPKTEIPGVGWFAFFSDPAGNRLALYTGGGG